MKDRYERRIASLLVALGGVLLPWEQSNVESFTILQPFTRPRRTSSQSTTKLRSFTIDGRSYLDDDSVGNGNNYYNYNDDTFMGTSASDLTMQQYLDSLTPFNNQNYEYFDPTSLQQTTNQIIDQMGNLASGGTSNDLTAMEKLSSVLEDITTSIASSSSLADLEILDKDGNTVDMDSVLESFKSTGTASMDGSISNNGLLYNELSTKLDEIVGQTTASLNANRAASDMFSAFAEKVDTLLVSLERATELIDTQVTDQINGDDYEAFNFLTSKLDAILSESDESLRQASAIFETDGTVNKEAFDSLSSRFDYLLSQANESMETVAGLADATPLLSQPMVENSRLLAERPASDETSLLTSSNNLDFQSSSTVLADNSQLVDVPVESGLPSAVSDIDCHVPPQTIADETSAQLVDMSTESDLNSVSNFDYQDPLSTFVDETKAQLVNMQSENDLSSVSNLDYQALPSAVVPESPISSQPVDVPTESLMASKPDVDYQPQPPPTVNEIPVMNMQEEIASSSVPDVVTVGDHQAAELSTDMSLSGMSDVQVSGIASPETAIPSLTDSSSPTSGNAVDSVMPRVSDLDYNSLLSYGSNGISEKSLASNIRDLDYNEMISGLVDKSQDLVVIDNKRDALVSLSQSLDTLKQLGTSITDQALGALNGAIESINARAAESAMIGNIQASMSSIGKSLTGFLDIAIAILLAIPRSIIEQVTGQPIEEALEPLVRLKNEILASALSSLNDFGHMSSIDIANVIAGFIKSTIMLLAGVLRIMVETISGLPVQDLLNSEITNNMLSFPAQFIIALVAVLRAFADAVSGGVGAEALENASATIFTFMEDSLPLIFDAMIVVLQKLAMLLVENSASFT